MLYSPVYFHTSVVVCWWLADPQRWLPAQHKGSVFRWLGCWHLVFVVLSNLLAQFLPLTLAFWIGAGIIFGSG